MWLPLNAPGLGDLAHNPGMCPDRERNRNRQPLDSQASVQSTEPHQPGQLPFYIGQSQKVSLIKWHFEQRPKGNDGASLWLSGRRIFQEREQSSGLF